MPAPFDEFKQKIAEIKAANPDCSTEIVDGFIKDYEQLSAESARQLNEKQARERAIREGT